jgi:beta-lactamase superfamily II metal-dependent hydrolase
MPKMNVKILPANNGDCLLISFYAEGMTRNILIDGGIGRTSVLLMKELKSLEDKGEFIDLLIVTHIDDDHIGGIVKLFSKDDNTLNIIKKVWFNSGASLADFFKTRSLENRTVRLVDSERVDVSVKQGNTLEKRLKDLGIWDESVIHNEIPNISFYGANIHILSPSITGLDALNNKWQTEIGQPENISSSKRDYQQSVAELSKLTLPSEDFTIPNGSSIALMIELDGLQSMYLADAQPTTLENALESLGYSDKNPVAVNLIKVSHHGSSYNISERLLRLWNCKNYVVSTNGAKHGLPNKLCLSKFISLNSPGVNIYFNYKEVKEKIFSPEDHSKYDFKTIDLSERDTNYTITIK